MKSSSSLAGWLLAFALSFLPFFVKAAGPQIIAQPQEQTVLADTPVQLQVVAEGDPPLSYHWRRNGHTFLVEDTGILELPHPRAAALDPLDCEVPGGGEYSVVVSNATGTARSSNVWVTVVSKVHPPVVTAATGARVNFQLCTLGNTSTVRWLKDGQPLEALPRSLGWGLNLINFTVSNAVPSDAGDYSVSASNSAGVVQSPAAPLTIVTPGPLDQRHPIGTLPIPPTLSYNHLYNLRRLNELFFAVGTEMIAYSTNGAAWTQRTFHPSTTFYDITFGRGTYVAVGEAGQIVTSTNLTDWTARAFDSGRQHLAVTYGNGVFVVVGQAVGQSPILTSTNGRDWVVTTPAQQGYFTSVAWGDGQFAASHINGMISTSTDGFNWLPRMYDRLEILYSIAHGNGRFVAVGAKGMAVTSSDGVTWTRHPTSTPEWFGRVVFEHGLFLGMTRSSSLLSSSDGQHWTLRTRGTNELIEASNFFPLLCPGNGTFVIGGANGVLLETAPVISLSLRIAESPQLIIRGPVGCRCQIQSTESFGPLATWQRRGDIVLPASPFTWTDPSPAASFCIYRLLTGD